MFGLIGVGSYAVEILCYFVCTGPVLSELLDVADLQISMAAKVACLPTVSGVRSLFDNVEKNIRGKAFVATRRQNEKTSERASAEHKTDEQGEVGTERLNGSVGWSRPVD